MGLLTPLVERTPLALVVVGIVVVVLGAVRSLSVAGANIAMAPPWNYAVIGLGGICFALGIVLIVSEHGRTARTLQPWAPDQFGQTLAISGYARSHIPEFYAEVEKRIRRARRVKFISMGLQILREGNVLDILTSRAMRGDVEVVACMGNPYSPDVVDRLIEEEMSDSQPQIGRHGIDRNIKSLLDHLDKYNNPANFRVLLFEHYPTFATYVIDSDVFVVPYMYRLLGWQAPVLHLRDDGSSEIARFFVENADRVLADAIPAQDVFHSQPDRLHRSEDWIQVCVAIVPGANEPLYQFGTRVIGYDLRTGRPASRDLEEMPNLERSIGSAAQRGFHAPLVDPLYVPNEAAVRHLVAELTVLSDELPRFELVNPRIEDRWQTYRDIVLRCDDHSGVAEAVHGELVSRLYRRAVRPGHVTQPGQQSLNTTSSGRSGLMTRRYGSPHVLTRFDVHFPLCCDPPVDSFARRGLVEQLDDACRERVAREPVVIDRLHLLVKRSSDPSWRVLKVYSLS